MIRPLLVIGAAAIWGAVLLRFSGYMSGTETSVVPTTVEPGDTASFVPERTDVVFLGNYRDPFIPDAAKGELAVSDRAATTVETAPDLPEWPDLELRGIIGTTALIHDHSRGGLRYIEPGEDFEGITLSSIHGDSVMLSLGSERLFLKVQ